MEKKVMILEPGPNNGTVGCGGSIIKHIEKWKNSVYMVSLTFGDAPTADFVPSDFRNIREEESRRAAKVLGVSQDCLHFLGHKVFAINKERAVQEVMSILRKVKPDICYIPSPEGNHPDYAATYEVATIALSFSGGKWFKSANNNQDSWTVPTVLIYEVSVPLRSPSYYEVISEYVEQKKRALVEHFSQGASRRYDEGSYNLARFRGITFRGEFCEAFQVWRVETIF